MRQGAAPARAGAALASCVIAGTGLIAASPTSYRDGAPPGFSGGFGEESCRGCHFDGELNEAPGRVTLEGVPTTWEPGRAYYLTVALTRPDMALAGFQLAARFEDGKQAGSLDPASDSATGVAIAIKADTGVQYAHQGAAGAAAVADGAARWTVRWTSPSADARAVLFHVAANAADGDESASGDYAYTTAATSHPR